MAFRLLFRPKTITNQGVVLDLSLVPFESNVLRALYSGGWEREESFLLDLYLRPEDRVLELGGCIGFISILALKKGCLDVVTVEANPNLIPIIERNAELNKVALTALNKVIGSETSYTFFVSPRIFSSSLEQRGCRASPVAVDGISLERISRDISFTFLIIDIEGGEYDLLLDTAIPESIDRMMIEFHGIAKHSGRKDNKYLEVKDKLSTQGFVQKDEKGRNHFFERL